MRKIRLLAGAAFGAALFAAAPMALAQQQGHSGKDYGFNPPPGTPMTPGNQGAEGLIPPVAGQYQAARRAESNASHQVDGLLRQADAALSRGNAGLANEYLERAETALLNTDNGPSRTGAQGEISAARQALMSRDRQGALQHIRTAMGMAGSGAGMATGTDTWRATPSQGGGGASVTTVPQAWSDPAHLGRGNAAATTRANPTAVPPYGGPGGTGTMPSAHMPGTSGTQAAGVPSVAPTGRGAPPPGQPFPQAGGSSSNLSTGGQVQPGSPGLSGTGGSASGGGPGGSAAGGGGGR